MATSSGETTTCTAMPQPEVSVAELGALPSVEAYCERCCMPLSKMANVSRNSSLPQQTGLSSQNVEENYDMLFIDGFQLLCKRRPGMLRPLLSNTNDLGRLNIELMDLMSDSPMVAHPVCNDCADSILDYLDQQQQSDEEDPEKYKQLLFQLETGIEDDASELKAEFLKCKETEARLQEELSQVETQLNEVKEIKRSLEKDCDKLESEINKVSQRISETEWQKDRTEDDFLFIENQITYVRSKLDKLEKTDVLRLGFKILSGESIGSINGYRLGRLPNIPVPWAEISAAWGQTVLLLHSLSKLINFTIENHELVPISNHSYVKLLQGNKVEMLPLFYSGESNLSKKMEFDRAMVEFLNYLQNYAEAIEEDKSIRLPYPIQRGKVIDRQSKSAFSVKIQLNTEENWTKALKFMLTNLSWALAWSTKNIPK